MSPALFVPPGTVDPDFLWLRCFLCIGLLVSLPPAAGAASLPAIGVLAVRSAVVDGGSVGSGDVLLRLVLRRHAAPL